MKAKISFDAIVGEDEDQPIMEGCYCLNSNEWFIFFFTKKWRNGEASICLDAEWKSGAKGIDVHFEKDRILSKTVVKYELAKILGVSEWEEVKGPDSLAMK